MAATANRDLVIARDFGPKARRTLILIALVLMALGYTGYMTSQTITVVVFPRESPTGPEALLDETGLDPREAGLGILLGLLSGAIGGAGVGVLLYAFAHPMVRHRVAPYIALVLIGQALLGQATPALLRTAPESSGVVRVTTGPYHLANDVWDLVGQIIPALVLIGAAVLIAWVLLRPEDFEGTWIHRRYLARDLPPAEPAPQPPQEDASL